MGDYLLFNIIKIFNLLKYFAYLSNLKKKILFFNNQLTLFIIFFLLILNLTFYKIFKLYNQKGNIWNQKRTGKENVFLVRATTMLVESPLLNKTQAVVFIFYKTFPLFDSNNRIFFSFKFVSN